MPGSYALRKSKANTTHALPSLFPSLLLSSCVPERSRKWAMNGEKPPWGKSSADTANDDALHSLLLHCVAAARAWSDPDHL